MAGGVDVNIGADTREFDKSVRTGMQDPVKDAQQALEEYVAAAQQGGDTLERTFTDQQRATTELRGDIDQLNRTIRDSGQSSYRKAGVDADDFRRRSEEGFEEIRESARSNAIEVGASFTGGFDQAVGGLQGFVAEFLAGFGPAGVIAGVGAAALLGTITAAIDSGQQAAEAQKAAISSLAQEYIDAGSAGRRTFDSVADSIKSMATSTDGSDVIITLQQAFDRARTAGADYQRVVTAIASESPTEIARARAEVERLASAHAHVVDTSRSAARGVVIDNGRQVEANRRLVAALDEAERQAKAAGRAEQLAARAGLSDLQLKQDLIHQVETAYDDAAGAIDDYRTGEHKTLDVKAYLAAMHKRAEALEEYHDAVAKSKLSPAAIKFLEQQGEDSAAAALRGYQKASPEQQRQLEHIWTTAGTENATNYQDAIGKQLNGKTFAAPKVSRPVVPAADTSALDRQLANPRTMRVLVGYYDRKGQRLY